MTLSGTVNLDGDRASARWCMNEVGRRHDGAGLYNFGLSVDELVRVEERWLFARRSYRPIYFEEKSLPSTAFPPPR